MSVRRSYSTDGDVLVNINFDRGFALQFGRIFVTSKSSAEVARITGPRLYNTVLCLRLIRFFQDMLFGHLQIGTCGLYFDPKAMHHLFWASIYDTPSMVTDIR
ncbi:hypothetical protein K443DRAFT_325194 [Laccaria amethystina LaAM-08-1]|uniref:Uncharacterized protein n=1 Tax=Laccaria amethystina LaAM-08-1 TaxID=1095629 RepID=A0A0C9WJY1_9AGAR|nr:hypothetical protein K443DRAFT_325194 [Laccaria amethystina LaAM-08-1]